jgi:prefoldin subunit 5
VGLERRQSMTIIEARLEAKIEEMNEYIKELEHRIEELEYKMELINEKSNLLQSDEERYYN